MNQEQKKFWAALSDPYPDEHEQRCANCKWGEFNIKDWEPGWCHHPLDSDDNFCSSGHNLWEWGIIQDE